MSISVSVRNALAYSQRMSMNRKKCTSAGKIEMSLIGLIDVDGHGWPSLPLMKISAYHKSIGDVVRWYSPLDQDVYDKVYLSKVFTSTPDYKYKINAKEIIKGGTGYDIVKNASGSEVYIQGNQLPDDVEHIYPDYGLYGITDVAYGFLTRGCPRNCGFCHVSQKEGRKSVKVANLSEFWNGQRHIKLLDANILACPDWRVLFDQLEQSGASVEFTQGLDARLLTDEIIERISKMTVPYVYFALDSYGQMEQIIDKLKRFKDVTGWSIFKVRCYVLVNYDTSIQQDLERIYALRNIGVDPYVMIYDSSNVSQGSMIRKMGRWCNHKAIFRTVDRFEDYDSNKKKFSARSR